MKPARRLLGLLVVAGVLAGGMLARAQQGLPTPEPLKLSESPPATQPQAASPSLPAAPSLRPPDSPPSAVLPGPEAPPPPAPGPARLPASPAAPTAAAPHTLSVNDIVIEPTAGPTSGNPTARQEPGVSLEWICPATSKLGQPLTCQIVVKSLSTNRLHQVVLRARMPVGVVTKATEPKATSEGDLLVWDLGTMEPREERRLDLLLVPMNKINLALNAFVTFTGSSTARVDVREPKLVLKAIAPSKVITGDPATVTLTVSNPGDATAECVKVKAVISDGLEHGRGQTLEFNLDSLAPKESRTVLVLCSAKTVGEQSCNATATAEPGLTAQDGAAIEVVAPRLGVVVCGPGMRYLDRPAVLTFKVTNPGTATANHVSLNDQVPPGFRVIAASGGGRHDFVTRTVAWFLGDLGPGQSKEVSLELLAINPGEHHHKAIATAARGLRAEGDLCTRVEGLPALLMELVDLDDPVEVGKQTSYEIRVTNTGTKTETNLHVSCTLPEGMEFIAAKGAAGCPCKLEGRELVFDPLPKLAPRVDAIYRVTVRCRAAGDMRFQARMKADGLTLPVLREESTRVYGDEPEASGAAPKQ
jgi:uncharacterized repeat protein (TIGR01451 family)